MLTIKISDKDCSIDGSATVEDITAACAALLATIYKTAINEKNPELTFEKYVYDLIIEPYDYLSKIKIEEEENDNTHSSNRSVRKLS